MEAALVSMATGALNSVMDKLGALLGDEYKCFKGVRKEIKFLIDELAAVHAFLTVMSGDDDPNEKNKAWMTAARDLSYDMEDSIDDVMQSVHDKDTKPEVFIEHMMHSLGKLRKMKARCWVGKENQILKKKIIEVSDRNERNKTGVSIFNTNNATVDPRALAMFEEAEKLLEIGGCKAEVIKLLTEGASTQDQPKVLSILGLGKTSIANQVYEYFKGKFQCRVFLSVSRNPDMMNILRTIFSELSGQGYPDTEAVSVLQLVSKIKNFLADKRYFVVLDDICDKDAWEVIMLAFPMTSSGSIIITTAYRKGILSCPRSVCGGIYIIRRLNMVNSRQLFHRRLFDSNEDCPSHLEKVYDKILEKCNGLPLAIITISGLLANRERTENLWNQVADLIDRALESNPGVEIIMKILFVSYFDLPPHLKCCLLYMSIFPEDFIIEKKYLISRWICEGFIHKEDKYTVYEIGEMCFNELLNRCLIQPVETDQYGRVKTCRVDGTILDFIISKSMEENFVTLLGFSALSVRTQSKVVRRLSVQSIKEIYSTIQTADLVLSHVRSLNVFGDSVEIRSFEELRHLRVLDLKHCHQLEDHHLENIVKLFHLRYLNLDNTGISELPEQIGRLGCLEMLDLRCTSVEEFKDYESTCRNLSLGYRQVDKSRDLSSDT